MTLRCCDWTTEFPSQILFDRFVYQKIQVCIVVVCWSVESFHSQYQLENLYVNVNAVATGWGTLKEDGKPSCILQEVEVPVLSNDLCVQDTNYTDKMITENMLCAGYPGVGKKDSCQVSPYLIMYNLNVFGLMVFTRWCSWVPQDKHAIQLNEKIIKLFRLTVCASIENSLFCRNMQMLQTIN